MTYGAEPFVVEVVILPAMVEDGRPNADEALYATDFLYDLPGFGKGSRVGLEFNHVVGNPMPLRAGVNFTHLSGDDDTDPNDDETNRFAAYESVTDLMILEDPYYGFDWDSNYEAFKAHLGTAFSLAGGTDNLEAPRLL